MSLLARFSQSRKSTAPRPGKPTNFFIVGCVRSGTTMLRDLLRMHPMLACPEENHVYRWSWPYRTGNYRDHYEKQAIFKRHQELDGVSHKQVSSILNATTNRAQFLDGYCQAFMQAQNLDGRIWYEKTPQNVYGMLLIRGEMPGVKFLNIVRNPLNVVASLQKGLIMKEYDIVAACAYWREAVLIADQYRQAFPSEIEWIEYEDLIIDPRGCMKRILAFLNLPNQLPENFDANIHPERNQYLEVLTPEHIALVKKLCSPVIEQCKLKDYFRGIAIKGAKSLIKGRSNSGGNQAASAIVPTLKLPMKAGNWLKIAQSTQIIERNFTTLTQYPASTTSRKSCPVPTTLFQYWDKKNKPKEIKKLIEHNETLCKDRNVRYVLFHQEDAVAYLKSHFHPDFTTVWNLLPHPAMQSDLLRLCYLYKEGGFYLDADMALRTNFNELMSIPGDFFGFKWNLEERQNICNWLIGSQPGNPCMRFILQTVWHRTATACRKNPNIALKNILGTSGPAAFTNAIAAYVQQLPEEEIAAKAGIKIFDVPFAYKYVMNGPELLKTRGMPYKKTKLHWQQAAKEL